MHRAPLIPTENAEQFAQSVYGLWDKLSNKFRQARGNRQQFKAEPRIAVPVIQQEFHTPYPQQPLIYAQHRIKPVDVMARRLETAQIEQLKLGDILNEEQIALGQKHPLGIFDHERKFRYKMLVRTFKMAADTNVADADLTLTRVTLGPDPYNGKDAYPRADALDGGRTHNVLYTNLTQDNIAALIQQARAMNSNQSNSAPALTPPSL